MKLKIDLFDILFYPYIILQSVVIPLYLGKIKYIDKENIISMPLYTIISIISIYIFINLFLIMISYYRSYEIIRIILAISILLSFIYFILLIIILFNNNFKFKNYSENEKNATYLIIMSNILIIILIMLCCIWLYMAVRF